MWSVFSAATADQRTPSHAPRLIASIVVVVPSLAFALARWYVAVRSVQPRRTPISFAVNPPNAKARQLRSRGLRPQAAPETTRRKCGHFCITIQATGARLASFDPSWWQNSSIS